MDIEIMQERYDEMAASSGRRTSSSDSHKRSTSSGGTSSRSTRANTQNSSRRQEPDEQQLAKDSALFHEIGLIVLFVAMLILFFCNFGIIGPVGDAISGFLFGLFGFTAYAVPVLLFLAAAFWYANDGNPTALRKLVAGIVLFVMLGVICDLVIQSSASMDAYSVKTAFHAAKWLL